MDGKAWFIISMIIVLALAFAVGFTSGLIISDIRAAIHVKEVMRCSADLR